MRKTNIFENATFLFVCNHHRTNHHNTVITRDKYSCEIPFDQIKLTDGDLVLDEDGLDVSICIRFIITDKLKKKH